MNSENEPEAEGRSKPSLAFVLTVVVIFIVLGIGAIVWWTRRPEAAPDSDHYVDVRRMAETPTGPPPVLPDPPAAVSAALATHLPDDAQVLGVTAGGKYRAYVLSALGGSPEHHIVNDLVGGVPVTVTYCDLFNCAQVVKGDDKSSRPLQLSMFGVSHEGMKLRVGNCTYNQSSLEPLVPDFPAFPYQKYPFERTSWKAWKAAHPDTDVFLSWDGK